MSLNDLYNLSRSFTGTEKMPVLFLGHGNPMNAIEENEFTLGWRTASAKIPKPNAILTVSAHWETRGTFVTAMQNPKTIHDFGGFPEELYQVQYPAPGSPELAQTVSQTVKKSKVEHDVNWGLDHGTWSVLKHFYPEADIPIVQLSLDRFKPPQYHYELAGELSSLREKGVLIVGSGNIVHNLRLVDWSRMDEVGYAYDWAQEANTKIRNCIDSKNHKPLIDYKSQGNAMQLAIPTPEHFLPLLYTLALQNDKEEIEFFNDLPVAGSLTMTSLKIG